MWPWAIVVCEEWTTSAVDIEWAKEDVAGYWTYCYCCGRVVVLLFAVVFVVGRVLRSSGFGAVAVVCNYCNVDVVIDDYKLDS
jgi:hypothetical protein